MAYFQCSIGVEGGSVLKIVLIGRHVLPVWAWPNLQCIKQIHFWSMARYWSLRSHFLCICFTNVYNVTYNVIFSSFVVYFFSDLRSHKVQFFLTCSDPNGFHFYFLEEHKHTHLKFGLDPLSPFLGFLPIYCCIKIIK